MCPFRITRKLFQEEIGASVLLWCISEEIRQRVLGARRIQEERYRGSKLLFNAELSGRDVKKYCVLSLKEKKLLEELFVSFQLSARSYFKVMKLARTIADLEGENIINEKHIYEAISFRTSRMEYWGG